MDIHIGAQRQALGVSAERLRRLGHPLRLAMLELLRQRDELCVCAMAAALGAEQATLSRHLRILRDGHLVRARRDGPNVFYSIDATTLAGLTGTLGGLLEVGTRGKESGR